MAKSTEQDFEKLFTTLSDPMRIILDRTWFRNILYCMGEQWLSWFNEQQTFGRQYEYNTNMPTPVSNFIRDAVKSVIALVLNKQYVTSIWPNSNDQEDKDAAEVGVAVLEYMDALNDYEIYDVQELLVFWWAVTGNAFARTFASNDSGRYIVDGNGKLVVNSGEVVTECMIPFNVKTPNLGQFLRDKEYVGIETLKSIDWVEKTFKKPISLTRDSSGVEYQRKLLTLVANVSPWKGRGFEMDLESFSDDDLVMFREMEYRPSPEHPDGRYAVMCGGDVLLDIEGMPAPKGENGGWDYTLTHFRYNVIPGNFWGSGAIDDLVSPQNTTNKIDQALEINRETFGRPYVLTPGDVVMRRISNRNQGILSISYDAIKAAGSKPVVHAGTPYPDQILKERENHLTTAQRASGDPKNVLSGAAPTSGASGIMVDILRESAEQVHSPDIRRFYRGWNQVKRMRLVFAQMLYDETRFLKIKGNGNEIIVKEFKGSDLRGNLDVRLELSSGLSSTHVGKNQFIMELIKGNFWGDINTKPSIQRELLKRFGLGGFPEENNMHRSRAEYENSLVRAEDMSGVAFPGIPAIGADGNPVMDDAKQIIWEIPPVIDPVFQVDDPLVHMQSHDQAILSREFPTWPERAQVFLLGHRKLHEKAWEAKMMMEQLQEQQANQSKVAGEEGGGVGVPAIGNRQGG